ETFRHGRCAASPLEPRGIIARFTPDEGLEVWASTQTPHMLRDVLAAHLGLAQDRVRVIVPDVGGGFGQKLHVFPEDLAVAAVAPLGTASILPGPYRIGAYAFTATAVSSPKPPLGAYRGVGMVMGAFVMERTLDLIAGRLSLDPAEIRRRNLIPRDAYPYRAA